MSAENRKDEVFIKITLALPFVVRLNDGEYICKMNKNSFGIKLTFVNSVMGDQNKNDASFAHQSSTGQLTEAKNVSIPGAHLQYSLVDIMFTRRVDFSSPEAQQNCIEESIEKAYIFLNRFVDVYRLISCDTNVVPLTRADFYGTRANQSLHFWANCPSIGKLAMGSHFGKQGISAAPNPLGDELQNKIIDFLKSGEQPQIIDLLLLNAKSYIEKGDYRLAVIELGSALDINVEQVAKRLLNIHKEYDIKNSDSIDKMTTKKIIENIISKTVPTKINDSSEWLAVDNKFRELRNTVIHDAYVPSLVEAEDAMNIIRTFCDLLRDLKSN